MDNQISLPELKSIAESHEPLSYKQLCERLNLKYYSGGNSKKRQLEDLTTICRYHIDEHPTKYIIDEYYEAFAPSLVNGRNKYVPYIEAILCSMLKLEEKAFLTNGEILYMCKIVNENFSTARVKTNQVKICNQLGYDLIDFMTFVDNTYTYVLAPVVRSALKSLERRSVISIASTYKILNEVDENCTVAVPVPYESDLRGELQQIEYDAKEVFGIKNGYIYPSIATDYYDYCNKLAKERLGIKGFFTCKQITTKKAIVSRELPKIIKLLNESVTDKVFSSKYLDSLTNEFKKIMGDDMLSMNPSVRYLECVRIENDKEKSNEK